MNAVEAEALKYNILFYKSFLLLTANPFSQASFLTLLLAVVLGIKFAKEILTLQNEGKVPISAGSKHTLHLSLLYTL